MILYNCKKLYFFLWLLIILPASSIAQDSSRPKIGLTLSGGGAKGLAHIGILKAIDSAGLKIDYISGTSMGSIIGSLYAVGYSADSLEKIARKIDWDLMLSNQSSLRSLFMEEKDEYSKYVIELPWQNNNFRLPSGVLEGQELWLWFSELYFPVYNIKDFSKFSIPFRCISTDVGNGEAVVLKDGEIITAVRSSMAIPSLFTAVDHQGHKMVDGGLVRNFPVKDVKDMGADIVIGSNVAGGLLPSEKIRNALQILLQIAFFRESEDIKKEVPQCNIYIPFNMEKYTMGSFSNANEILQLGLDEGRRMYPVFKKLADSLNAIYGKTVIKTNRLPDVDRVKISSYEVRGVERTTASFFVHTIDFIPDQYYSAKYLSNMVRQAYGTRYYSRVNYSLVPNADGSCKIIFDVTENPFTFAKIGLHYNRFSGISVISNITSRNLLFTNSRSLVTLKLGETFGVRGEHLQYFGRRKNISLIVRTQFERFNTNTYNQFEQVGLYKQNFFEFSERLQYSGNRLFSIGIGHRFEWLRFDPTIAKGLEFKGSNNFMSFFGYFQYNSLDKNVLPRRGIKIDAEFARVSTQHPDLNFLLNGQPPTNPDSLLISNVPYYRSLLNIESYFPISSKLTFYARGFAGVNYNYKRNVMNEFSVGGLTKTFRNQLTFSGLQEGSLNSPATAMLQGAFRWQTGSNIFLTGRANFLFNNFISTSDFFVNPDMIRGYSLSFTYNFALGPLEISAMYNNYSKKLETYINLGIPF